MTSEFCCPTKNLIKIFQLYVSGWAISSSERDWKYRLSIYYAKSQDSGLYTCTTPKNLTNSINLHVTGEYFASR